MDLSGPETHLKASFAKFLAGFLFIVPDHGNLETSED